MKKLTKISLHTLSQAELQKRELNAIRGGVACGCATACSCSYAGDKEGPNDSYYGGSSQVVSEKSNTDNLMFSISEAKNPSI